MTTGGGGMIVTDDKKLANRARHMRTTAKTDPLEYDHDEVGYNYRLVNVLAAIGLAQLESMPGFIETKRKNLYLYKSLIEDIPGMFIHQEPQHSQSNYWMYSLVFEPGFKYSVLEMVNKFGEVKIQTRPIWKLMNMLPMYKDCQSYHCEVSADIYKRVLSIPCSTNLEEKDIHRVVEFLKYMS